MAENEVTEILAVVRSVEGDQALVEVNQSGGCGRCHEKGGCGGQNLSQMLCDSQKSYRVSGAQGVAVGDTVRVAVTAGAIRRGANLAYGLPVVAMIVGAILGTSLGGDVGGVTGCLGGALAAWLFVRHVMHGERSGLVQPRIVGR